MKPDVFKLHSCLLISPTFSLSHTHTLLTAYDQEEQARYMAR
jgi:hypothetical protein